MEKYRAAEYEVVTRILRIRGFLESQGFNGSDFVRFAIATMPRLRQLARRGKFARLKCRIGEDP